MTGLVIIVAVCLFCFWRFAREKFETGRSEGFKQGWIAGIDYEQGRKDGEHV